jgi:acyl carrier protein
MKAFTSAQRSRLEGDAVVPRRVVTITLSAEPTRMSRDADIRDELDLDSMDFTNFVISLHEQLGLDIPEVDYRKYYTVEGAVEMAVHRADVEYLVSGRCLRGRTPRAPFLQRARCARLDYRYYRLLL